MRKSFYHFLMRYRDEAGNDHYSEFANSAFNDHSFPKQALDFYEISAYLELNGSYLPSMTVFDQVWEEYEVWENKR
ncbi:YozE family protein [Bacillus sp. 2205SS5-2]|uniref:YozE family protein n=1 Tax=Bacillus sp. 2205SS5-2 TaxID=3109031 RepID=UPI003005BB51